MDGIMYTLIECGKKELDKIPYNLPQPSPTDSEQRKKTPDKDNNTLITS